MGDSSSGDELGLDGGRFPDLSDSIEIRRLRVSDSSDSRAPVLGASQLRADGGSGLGSLGGSQMIGDALLNFQNVSGDGVAVLTSMGVAVDGLVPVAIEGYLHNQVLVHGGFSSQVVGKAEHVISSSLDAEDFTVQVSSDGVADVSESRRSSSNCPMPAVVSALGLSSIADGVRTEARGSVSAHVDACSQAIAESTIGSSPTRGIVGAAQSRACRAATVGTDSHRSCCAVAIGGEARPVIAARLAVGDAKQGLGKDAARAGMGSAIAAARVVDAAARPLRVTAKPVLGNGKVGPSRSYAAVTVSDMKSNVKLSFVPPVISKGKKQVVLCESDCRVDDFKFSLVGYFLDGCMQFAVVRSLAFKLWKTAGLVDVRTLDNGFFVFIFASDKARDDVLERGPWFFLRTPIFLRRWERMMSRPDPAGVRFATSDGPGSPIHLNPSSLTQSIS
ncbi:hypothetical protein Dimus_037457 [Dionaea muscipula]